MFSALSKAVSALTSDLPSDFPRIIGPASYCIADEAATSKSSSNVFYNAKPLEGSYFTLFEAKSAEGEPLSVFGFPKSCQTGTIFNWQQHCSGRTGGAVQALKLCKTLKHDSMLKFVDGCDVGSGIYIATEHVTALRSSVLGFMKSQDYVSARRIMLCDFAWSVCSLLQGIEFINCNANKVWCSLSPNTVFVTDSCEWKLGLAELAVSNETQLRTVVNSLQDVPFGIDMLQALQGERNQLYISESSRVDRVTLTGVMIWSYKAHAHLQSLEAQKPSPFSTRDLNEWHTSNTSQYHSMNTKLKEALSVLQTSVNWTGLEQSLPYFRENTVVKIQLFIRSIALQDDSTIEEFFSSLPEMLHNLPASVRSRQILEILSTNLTMLNKVPAPLRIGAIFSASEGMTDSSLYRKLVLKPLIPYFKSSDRVTRFSLLQHNDQFGPHLNSELANAICDDLARGFADTSAEIKDCTIRTMFHFVPIVSSSKQDGLLQVISKCATTRPETYIRQNALICLCRSFNRVAYSKRIKLILPSLLQGLQDPNPETRQYVLRSMMFLLGEIHPRDLLSKVVVALTQFVAASESAPIEQRAPILRDEVYPLINESIRRSYEYFVDGVAEGAFNPDGGSGYLSSLDKHASSLGSWMTSFLTSPGSKTDPNMNLTRENGPTNAQFPPQLPPESKTNIAMQPNHVHAAPPVNMSTSTVTMPAHATPMMPRPSVEKKEQIQTPPRKNSSLRSSATTRLTSDPFRDLEIKNPSRSSTKDPSMDDGQFDDLLNELECDAMPATTLQSTSMPLQNNPSMGSTLQRPASSFSNTTRTPVATIPPMNMAKKSMSVVPNRVPLGMTSNKAPAKTKPKATSGADFWAEFGSDDSS